MKKYFFISVICLTVLGESKEPCPVDHDSRKSCSHESDTDQSIICICKGKFCDGSIISRPFKNHKHGGKKVDYCGIKTTEDATNLCQKHCRSRVKETKIFEEKK